MRRDPVTLFRRAPAAATAFALAACAGGPLLHATPEFERDVLPILEANCFECHGGKPKLKGSLRLTSRDGWVEGGDGGKIVDPEKPFASRVLAALRYGDESLRMPPAGKLDAAALAAIESWIADGMPWQGAADRGVPEESAARTAKKPKDPLAGWSYRPLVRRDPPAVRDSSWPRDSLDSFVLARLEAAGLRPAPQVGRRAFIRRASFDLLGLPPAPAEVEAFVADPAGDDQASRTLVEKLLASPHYGERWGRHWLDVVRYADTNGFERDGDKPFMWRYRDWVVRALNDDLPYDRFVLAQLAGDELDEVTPDSLTATGYLRLMQWDDEPPQGEEQARYDVLDDVAKTTGEALLGMSIGCARCHDHKADPIAQTDYYRFVAFFAGLTDFAKDGSVADVSPPELRAECDRIDGEKRAAAKPIEEAIAALKDDPAVQERVTALRAELDAVNARPVPRLLAPAAREAGREARDVFVLARGNAAVKGEKVAPGVPKVLASPPCAPREPPSGATSSHRRRALAEWIVDPRNPLPPRVIANRLWQFHFGRGIVRSSNDFGELGTRPTHPELLDHLATELIASGWSLKAMHRRIMNSASYRMSGVGDAEAAEKDPTNDLFWRFEGRRLDAEEIRDAMLAVNGRLDPRVGGPSFYPRLPAAVLATSSRPHEAWGTSPPEELGRRSLYIKVKRSLLPPLFTVFDFADVDASCPVRFTTTQPTQALALLNSAEVHEEARIAARRLAAEAADDPAAVERLWRECFARPPSEVERLEQLDLLREQREVHRRSTEDALQRLCLLAFNLNEFVHVD